jgi:hypothetical protein
MPMASVTGYRLADGRNTLDYFFFNDQQEPLSINWKCFKADPAGEKLEIRKASTVLATNLPVI